MFVYYMFVLRGQKKQGQLMFSSKILQVTVKGVHKIQVRIEGIGGEQVDHINRHRQRDSEN